jgi:hypothetical protein
VRNVLRRLRLRRSACINPSLPASIAPLCGLVAVVGLRDNHGLEAVWVVRLHPACTVVTKSLLSAAPQESPGSLVTLWMKPTDGQGRQYVAVKGVDLQMSVDDLKTSWMVRAKRELDPSCLTLLLVNVSGEEPTMKEEEDAKELRPHHSLAKAGVADGACWLLAVLSLGSASSSPSKGELRPPGEFSAPVE